MLSKKDNELVTQTGPDTRLGRTLRRYWIPAALSSELPRPVLQKEPGQRQAMAPGARPRTASDAPDRRPRN